MPSIAIRRTRVEQLLDDHPGRRVILVRGPAGAGKTILVTQWVAAHGHPCAWFSINSTHNGPDRLLWHVVEALERLAPEATAASVDRLRRDGGIDHTVLWDLLDLVAHDLRASTVLVFDDVHRLRDRGARHVVSQLVEHPPESTRVVLVSRSKPRLGLERARLRGDLVEVTPAALRFEGAEIDTLTATWTGRHPDTAELELTTLGWAAGLRLEQLDAAAEDEPYAARNESGGLASEYVREELFDVEPEDLPAFLDVTCWLPVLTESLRAAIAAQNGRPLPLTWSDLEALPILAVASRPGAFRYPPILTRVVQQEYCRRNPRAAAAARRRAAEACRQAGELIRSIELFLEAGCTDEAAEVCARLAARDEESLSAVDELLRRVPGLAPSSARWLPWRIRAAVAAGQVDDACRLLEQADHLVTIPGRSGRPASRDLLIARALLAERIGDVSALLAAADRLLAPADGTRADGACARKALGWQVRGLVWSGDVNGAKVALRALEQTAGGSTSDATLEVALARGWVAWLSGDRAAIIERVAGARPEHDDDLEHALLAGSTRLERNQTAKAVPLLRKALALAAASSHHVVAALAASQLARCHRAAGAVMDGLELTVSTRAAHPRLPAAVDAHICGTEVLLRLDQGDLGGARTVLHEAPPGVDAELLAARIALHQVPATAHQQLETIDAQTPRQAVEKLLLHAQLPDIDEADASAALVAAISVGGHLGLVRTFLDEGPALSRRLQELALESPDRTLGRLAALVSQELALAPARSSSQPIDQLTSRELAVLRMLPLRISNREMAAQMYISVNTLKTHVRAIYRKLDVPHRSAAVQRAKALQLV